VENAILYCGYHRDAQTGLYHVRHRMYHPLLGRWLQRDPLGYVDRLNLFESALGSPNNIIDPFGLQGHHAVPQAVTQSIDGLSEEAKKVLLTGPTATTGELPKGVHFYDDAHRQYSDAVKDLAAKWMKERKIDPSKMTGAQAEELITAVKTSKVCKIRDYLACLTKARKAATEAAENAAKIAAKNAAKKVGRKLIKRAGGVIGVLLTLGSFLADCAEGGTQYAVVEAAWPLEPALKAALNTLPPYRKEEGYADMADTKEDRASPILMSVQIDEELCDP
jgi:RHS repeat-associated protein